MDPRLIGPEQWIQIERALASLVLFVFLAVNTALSFLIAHAVIPSLATTGDVPGSVQTLRRVLYPVSALSLLAALYAFGRSLLLTVTVIQQIFPRFAV